MKCLFVYSRNGFGHLRRSISIAVAMIKIGIEVDIWSDPKDLSHSSLFSDYEIRAVFGKLPPHLEGPYLDRAHEAKEYINFEPYDLVISDTIIEASSWHNNVILLSQFTWPHYYIKQEITPFRKYSKETIENYLDGFKRIYGMRLFSWEELRSNKNFVEIPFLDYWNLREKRNLRHSEKVVIIRSGIRNQSLNETYNKFGTLYQTVSRIEEIDWRPKAVFCRPGLSSILEILAMGAYPILIGSEGDFELERNTSIILKKKWGMKEKYFSKVVSKIGIERALREMERVDMVDRKEFMSSSELAIKILDETFKK